MRVFDLIIFLLLWIQLGTADNVSREKCVSPVLCTSPASKFIKPGWREIDPNPVCANGEYLESPNSAIKNIMDEISSLKEQNAGMNEGISSLKKQNADMNEGISSLKQQNAEMNDTILQQQEGISSLKQQNAEMNDTILQQQQGISSLKKQNAEMNNTILQQQKGISSLKKQNADMNDTILQQKEGISSLKKQNADMNDTILLQQKNTKTLKREVENLKNLSGIFSDKDAAAQRKIRSLEDQVEQLNDTCSNNYTFSKIINSLFASGIIDVNSICYMGMKNNEISDSAITASSSLGGRWGAQYGRLDYTSGSWYPTTQQIGEWIQVDFGNPKLVAAIVTQGGNYYWVTSYKVTCGTTTSNMATIEENGSEKVFSVSRSHTDTKVTNKFPKPMTCRYIRVYPQTWHNYIFMRLEFIRGECYDLY